MYCFFFYFLIDESNTRLPIDCGDIDINRGSGVYKIYPQGYGINVFCDMETENVDGGWTVRLYDSFIQHSIY